MPLTAAEALQSIGMDPETAQATVTAAAQSQQQPEALQGGPDASEAAVAGASGTAQGGGGTDSDGPLWTFSEISGRGGADSLSGDAGPLDASRVEAVCQSLLSFGVPISRLAPLLTEYPAALMAVPELDWQPKVRRL